MRCAECDLAIQPGWTFYEEVTGWRRRTMGRKETSVKKQKPTGTIMCRGCVELPKEMKGQLDIFGDEAS